MPDFSDSAEGRPHKKQRPQENPGVLIKVCNELRTLQVRTFSEGLGCNLTSAGYALQAGHCQAAGGPSHTVGKTEQQWNICRLGLRRGQLCLLSGPASSSVKHRGSLGPLPFPTGVVCGPNPSPLLGFHSSKRSPECPSSPACWTSSCPNTISSKKPPVSPGGRDG